MKSYGVAIALALFLGGLGAHWFYLDRPKRGILYVLFIWTLIPALLALIDLIRFLAMGKEKWQKVYGENT